MAEAKISLKEKRAKKKAAKEAERLKKMSEREKVEERREEVLSKGRKYKYPLQYAKHKVVLLTVVITILALAAVVGLGVVALYKTQDTSDVIYRITQILPVSVAEIDGEKVRYSDYLMIYRSTITPMEQQQGQLGNDADSDAMRAYYKRQALTDAEDYTYAIKLGREKNISVSDEEVDEAVNSYRTAGGIDRSEESFKRILNDNFGLSMGEYRRMVYLSLMKQKVSQEIDGAAKLLAADVDALIQEGKTLREIADIMEGKVEYEETGGLVDAMNIDGGRARVALKLSPGQISQRFLSNSGNGYYYVQLGEKGNEESQVSYESIQIPFTEFTTALEKIRGEGKVSEKIELEDINTGEMNEEEIQE